MKTLLWLVLIVGGATIVMLQQRTRAALQTSIAALESQDAEESRLTQQRERLLAGQATEADLDSLRRNHAELLRLRSVLANASVATADRAPIAAEPYPVTETGSVFNPKRVSTSDLKLKSEWRNAGTATPAASFETYCWAEQGGDIDVLLTTMLIDDAARRKAQEILNQMPPADRAKFGTPDQFIAMLGIGSGTPFEAIKVLGEHERAPGEVVLRTLWQYGDGRVRENTNVVLRETASGWRRPVLARQVEAAFKLRMSGWVPGGPPPPATSGAPVRK